MKKNSYKTFVWIGAVALAFVFVLLLSGVFDNEESGVDVVISTEPDDGIGDGAESLDAVLCRDGGGTWLEDFRECEGISETDCNSMGGSYDACANACRNDPEAEACILLCVPVCKVGVINDKVFDFNSCEVAGGAVMESYPRQCSYDGMHFVEKIV
ncbi:MAG: hypothetical protein MI892_00840, partial [Desulfobacterales bacterium]|nr:hypothetical protein [Desulfobacterales bacterium]